MRPIVNKDPNRKQRRVSDQKIWEWREKFGNSLSRARIIIEQAREYDVDLSKWVDQSGKLRQLSPMSAGCFTVLLAQIEGDEAWLEADEAKYG